MESRKLRSQCLGGRRIRRIGQRVSLVSALSLRKNKVLVFALWWLQRGLVLRTALLSAVCPGSQLSQCAVKLNNNYIIILMLLMRPGLVDRILLRALRGYNFVVLFFFILFQPNVVEILIVFFFWVKEPVKIIPIELIFLY